MGDAIAHQKLYRMTCSKDDLNLFQWFLYALFRHCGQNMGTPLHA